MKKKQPEKTLEQIMQDEVLALLNFMQDHYDENIIAGILQTALMCHLQPFSQPLLQWCLIESIRRMSKVKRDY
jgi:hypothetical protein